MGESATELVHIGRTAVPMGAPVDAFIQMIFNYLALTEGYKCAAVHLPTRTGQDMGL